MTQGREHFTLILFPEESPTLLIYSFTYISKNVPPCICESFTVGTTTTTTTTTPTTTEIKIIIMDRNTPLVHSLV